MKQFIKVVIAFAPLLLYAGVALAANSGVGQIDNSFTTGGHVITNDLGFGMGLTGALGVGIAMKHGIPHMGEGCLGWLLGGAGIYNYPTIAPAFSLSPAALIHPVVVHVAAHPVTHAALHLTTRLLVG
jgi:hypothetical protein